MSNELPKDAKRTGIVAAAAAMRWQAAHLGRASAEVGGASAVQAMANAIG
jgi:hypothetical protein